MTSPADSSREHSRARVIAARVAVVVLLVVLLAFWAQEQFAERGALEALSEPERVALYERTLHTLRTTCARPTGLDDFCRGQARFILQFPECDAACVAFARQIVREPTR